MYGFDFNIGKAMLIQVILQPLKLLFWHHVGYKPKIYFDSRLGRQYCFCTFTEVAGVKASNVARRHPYKCLFYVRSLSISNELADAILFLKLFYIKGLTCDRS